MAVDSVSLARQKWVVGRQGVLVDRRFGADEWKTLSIEERIPAILELA
jgi:hypothetical protein